MHVHRQPGLGVCFKLAGKNFFLIYFSQKRLLRMPKRTAQCLMLLDHLIGRKLIQVRHLKNVILSYMFSSILFLKHWGVWY